MFRPDYFDTRPAKASPRIGSRCAHAPDACAALFVHEDNGLVLGLIWDDKAFDG